MSKLPREEEAALLQFLDELLVYREYRLCGRWLVLQVDAPCLPVEVASRWVIGLPRAGWRSRLFWGRVPLEGHHSAQQSLRYTMRGIPSAAFSILSLAQCQAITQLLTACGLLDKPGKGKACTD